MVIPTGTVRQIKGVSAMKVLFAAALLLSPAAAIAQTAVVLPAAVPNVVRAGTPVALRFAEGISTKEKQARINDRIRMEVAEAVTVNGVVVIPAGSPAVGELTEVRNKGMWGKSGRIVGRVLSVNANGRTIRLSGTFDSKGGSGTGGAVAVSAVVFAPAGFFMTGKSAEMPAGTVVRGFLDEDVPFAVAAAAPPPQPMIVGK
jgi:hypothetical protein